MPHTQTSISSVRTERINLHSRRYIGSKAKLVSWIMGIIRHECPDARTFCDLFAGTGIVGAQAIPFYDKVTFNDLLISNNVIYKAFFGCGEWDAGKLDDILREYNDIDAEQLDENYFSRNFGGKYFGYNASKLIGFVRQDIENRRSQLTEKEYNVLLATLIYNIDRTANTLGHFDAYRKNHEATDTPLHLRLIDAHSYDNTDIFREDGNVLVHTLSADIVYIDPPYNSRQYNGAYHLYENLMRWEKPNVFGVARKLRQAETKSDYCTVKAASAFADLVKNIRARYIVLSYNNMAQKGNGRSNAKISDDEIMKSLRTRGDVRIFEHPHKPFAAGKSDIRDNRERLFVCTCRTP